MVSAAPAFNWNQYQTTGGVTGNASVDPSQLQVQSPGISLQNPAPTSPMNGGGGMTDPNGSFGGGGSANVPRDPSTGQPLNVQPGSGKPVDPSQWQQFTADLGVASDTNHQGINTLSQRLQQAGYQVQPGPVDSMGRQDSLVINGVLTRVFDSSGKWTPVQDNNGSAWSSGGSGGSGGMGVGFVGAPSPYDPGQFTAPTGLNYQNDPGYLARMQMGEDAIQNSAAARGSLLNGGTLKAIERYGQDYGSNEFGNVFNRALNTFGTNLNAGQLGYSNRYGQYTDYLNQLNNVANRGASSATTLYKPPTSGA